MTGVMGQARLVIDTHTESALPQAVVNQRDRCRCSKAVSNNSTSTWVSLVQPGPVGMSTKGDPLLTQICTCTWSYTLLGDLTLVKLPG